jgi:glycogen operon protein
LNDLVSYERKHNLDNGEDNRDGENLNYSSNYGIEGPTRRKGITTLRQRQAKNMIATLLLSQGVPMILSGDEVLRTQRGNNNAYCQDNAVSWFDWRLADRNAEMLRFVQALVAFRRSQPNVRRAAFLTGRATRPGLLPDVSWYDPSGKPVDWSHVSHSLISLFGTSGLDDANVRPVMLMLHADRQPKPFVIPSVAAGLDWRLFLDTAAEPPRDIYPNAAGPPPERGSVMMEAHSLRCYVAE